MILDGHIHIAEGPVNHEGFIKKLKSAGIDGGVILSLPPSSFKVNKLVYTSEERLDNLFAWQGSKSELYPFYWIDPMEHDAKEQVQLAHEYGVSGYKIICNKFYPNDRTAIEVYKEIAKTKKPLLFHSGILWDGQPSSKYNRPGEFEALLEINGLKFALAHVSWPWHDECIAVYGKFLHAYTVRPELSVEMFIDLTPGTPPIYRQEVLTKIFTVGYNIEQNVLFGLDSITNNYDHKLAKEWIGRDNEIYKSLGLDMGVIVNIYSENLKRFLGISRVKEEVKK